MTSSSNKKLIAVIIVSMFLVTFGSLISLNSNAVGNNHVVPSLSREYSKSVLSIPKPNPVLSTIHGNSLVSAGSQERQNLSLDSKLNPKIDTPLYNITARENGLNLSSLNWKMSVYYVYKTGSNSYQTFIYAACGSSPTFNITNAVIYPGDNYTLSFAYYKIPVYLNPVPLYSLNQSFSPVPGQYTYSFHVTFPPIYNQVFYFTNAVSSGTAVAGSVNFNNTTNTVHFSSHSSNFLLPLPAGKYNIEFTYNFSRISTKLTVTANASYNFAFTLYSINATINSQYAISPGSIILENSTVNCNYNIQSYLLMAQDGNNYIAYVGNGTYTILLKNETMYLHGSSEYSNCLYYALDQGFSLTGKSLSLSLDTPAISAHVLTFTNVPVNLTLMLTYQQKYAYGIATDILYNASSHDLSGSFTTLNSPGILAACFANASTLYHYSLSQYFNASSGSAITINLHPVTASALNTLEGSTTCFSAGTKLQNNLLNSVFDASSLSLFRTGSNSATFYLPDNSSQITIENKYENSEHAYITQSLVKNITASTSTVNASFLSVNNVTLSIPNVPGSCGYSLNAYGSDNGISFTSSEDCNSLVSPYTEVSIHLDIKFSLSVGYCSVFPDDITTSSLSIPVSSLYLHALSVPNIAVGLSGAYKITLFASSIKLHDGLLFPQQSNYDYNISSDCTYLSGGGLSTKLNLSLEMPVGQFYLYDALESCDTTGLSGIQLVFFLIGSISVNSTSIVSSNILPSLLLTSVDVSVSLNGFNSFTGDGLVNSSGDSYFGFFINEIIPYPLDTVILAESTENLILIAPASTNIEVNLYSDSPCIAYHPSLLMGLASPTTDFHTELVFENEKLAVEKYQVTFSETGLPSGTSWAVTFNGTTNESNTNTIVFTGTNGSYQFTVAAISGYTVSPSSGTVFVNGSSVTEKITFTVKPSSTSKYQVSFVETGLPSGASWSITIDSMTNSSTGNTITFMLSDGNYSYMSTNTANYTYSGPTTVTVNGSNVTINLSFSKTSVTTPPPPHVSVSISPIIIYAIVAIVVLGAVGFVFRAMRKR